MGYSNTTKLALRKDDGNESIVDWREHNNSNLDLIDTTVGNLVDAINNAKLLLGQLGYDQNGNPVVDAATARDTLDAAQSEDAAGSLYDAEQAIGVNAGNIATNAAAISSLQDSVSRNPSAVFGDTPSASCAANSWVQLKASVTAPEGYVCVAIARYTTSSPTNFVFASVNLTPVSSRYSEVLFNVRRVTSGDLMDVSVNYAVLCLPVA